MADACCTCEEIENMLDEFLEEVRLATESSQRKRTKRAPSKYNLFMRECLQRKKGEPGEHKEKFRACALEYRQRKKER